MRLIDADALERQMKKELDYQDAYLPIHFEQMMEDTPTVDAKPIRHGHWILLYTDNYKCSVCGSWWAHDDYDQMDEFHYCPACGAKMDEVEEDE